MSTRRLVVDLASPRPVWRIPDASVAAVRTALAGGWEVVHVRTPAVSDGDGSGASSAESRAAVRGAEIYLGFGVSAGVVAAGRGTLRWVHSGAAGVGSSLEHLAGTGIVFTNSAGVHAEPMADWVVTAIGFFARGLDRMVRAQAQGRVAQDEFTDLSVPIREFSQLRVGILGLGGVGSAVARHALALGMRVAAVTATAGAGGAAGRVVGRRPGRSASTGGRE